MFVCFFPDSVSTLKAGAVWSLSFLTVVVNALVIIVIWKDPYKQLKGTANYLILNLALSDLLAGIPGELLFGISHWLPYKNVTRAAYIFVYLAFYASLLTILGLAVERLIVISSPLNSMDYATSSYLSIGIMSIWLFAILLAFLPILGWPHSLDDYRVLIVDAVVVPILLSLLACYSKIYFIVRKTLYLHLTTSEERREQGLALTESARELEKLKRKERSVTYSVFILVGIFAVCWIPNIVMGNINEFCKSCRYKTEYKLSEALGLLHPLLNPIAYSLRTVKFRRALLKICKGCFCRQPNRRAII